MGMMDKAKDYAEDNPDKVELLVEKTGDFFDSKTARKYADKVDMAQSLIKSQIRKSGEPARKEEAEPETRTSSVDPVDGPPASPDAI